MVAICNSYLCKLCFVFDLNKNLTLKKDNLFSFSSLNRFFALSLDKIGCISTKKIKKRFFILFCLRFALSLQRIIKERTNMKTIISKEEALRRLVATKESKRQRIAVLKERMKEKYVNSMGVEPENILFL